MRPDERKTFVNTGRRIGTDRGLGERIGDLALVDERLHTSWGCSEGRLDGGTFERIC